MFTETNLFYILLSNFIILFFCFNFLIKKKIWTIYSYPTKIGRKVKPSKVYSALGIICVLGTLISFIIYIQLMNYEINNYYYFLIFLVFSTFIGLLDDILNLDPYLKLIIIFFICLFISFSYFSGITEVKDKFYFLVTIFIILIYYNSVNFIDGSDGFLICHIIFFILGSILIVDNFKIQILIDYASLLIIFLSSIFAFLYFNLSGKMIIGNTGSFAAAFILSYFSVLLMRNNLSFQFLILAMYPLIDVTLSLLNKIISRKNLMDKDFCYFFLKPIKNRGASHKFVLIRYITYNIFNFFALYLSIYINLILGLFFSIIISLVLILLYGKK